MKTKVEHCKRIRVHQLLEGLINKELGVLTWNDGSSVSFALRYFKNRKYLHVCYKEHKSEGRTQEFEHVVVLTRTPCHIGGYRYWLTCPLMVEGKSCRNKVSILYKPPSKDYFGCRHCHGLIYRSQCLSGLDKKYGKIISFYDIEKQEKALKRRFYAGCPTRKYDAFMNKAVKNYFRMQSRTNDLRQRLLLNK